MADLDNGTTPFKHAVLGAVLNDGAGTPATITLLGVQGSVTWTETGRVKKEARDRTRHQATPVIIETEDGNVTGSITLHATSFKGSSNTHPYEFITKTGAGASLTSTATGGAHCVELVLTLNSTVDGGGSQTATFAYCDCSNITVDSTGDEGAFTLSFDFVDYENRPTYA